MQTAAGTVAESCMGRNPSPGHIGRNFIRGSGHSGRRFFGGPVNSTGINRPGHVDRKHLSTWRVATHVCPWAGMASLAFRGPGSLGMSSSVSSSPRAGRIWRFLIGLQVALLVFSLVANVLAQIIVRRVAGRHKPA